MGKDALTSRVPNGAKREALGLDSTAGKTSEAKGYSALSWCRPWIHTVGSVIEHED